MTTRLWLRLALDHEVYMTTRLWLRQALDGPWGVHWSSRSAEGFVELVASRRTGWSDRRAALRRTQLT
jgi:hypothetical protein